MWKDYLSMSRKEQRGFFVLCVIIVLLLITRLTLPLYYPKVDMSVLVKDSIPLTWISHISPRTAPENSSVEGFKFTSFDPNQVGFESLTRMGVDEYVARNWVRFVERGGRFKEVDDLQRIYGITPELFEALRPFVSITDLADMPPFNLTEPELSSSFMVDLNRIEEKNLHNMGWTEPMIDSLKSVRSIKWFSQRYSSELLRSWTVDSLLFQAGNATVARRQTIAQDLRIDVNRADTSEWMLLRGVGPVTSRRIVAYRNLLGGFAHIDQIKEVFGVSPVLFDDIAPFLVLDSVDCYKIDINTASVRRLRDHPYLDFYQAKAIVDARTNYGVFKTPADIMELEAFRGIDWVKIAPYLSAETGSK
jgi:DNA uptake protein ComE-like DNA-binding protein